MVRFSLFKNSRLPDSWFMMLLSIILLITTYAIESYISSINFWQEVSERKIDLNMDDVNIFEYHGQKLVTYIKSSKLIMSSNEDSDIKNKLRLDYEKWQLIKPFGITYNDNDTQYQFKSGFGHYDRYNNIYALSDGIEIIEEENLANNNKLTNIHYKKRFTGENAIYPRNSEQIIISSSSEISTPDLFLKSNRIKIDIKNNHIILDNVTGSIEN